MYQFDLTADDYAEPSLRSFAWKPVIRYFLPHSLCIALGIWIFVKHAMLGSTLAASVIALLGFVAAIGLFSHGWRGRFVAIARGHYAHPERNAILGAHTLELDESGLTSTGPLHKTFRDWRSVNQVAFTPGHVLFYTAFGVIYVLPMRAVDDLDSLESFVKRKSTCKLAS